MWTARATAPLHRPGSITSSGSPAPSRTTPLRSPFLIPAPGPTHSPSARGSRGDRHLADRRQDSTIECRTGLLTLPYLSTVYTTTVYERPTVSPWILTLWPVPT